MTPSASVIIPAYNRAQYIQTAIMSVVGQTYSDLEVIVVDDGSGDGTRQVVEGYARKDSRVHVIQHTERKGAQAARNTGIRAARGEWVAFLDSDDQWLPDSLEVRLQLAREKGLDVVHSECYVLNGQSTELQVYGVPAMQGKAYKELLRFSRTAGPMFQGLLVSKKSLTRIGYLDEKIVSWQEWDTAIRLAKYDEFGFLPKPTFIYDCRHADTISNDLLRTAIGYEQVITKHRWSILRYLGVKALASHYHKAAGFYLEANKGVEAHRCLLTAFLLWPFRPRTIFRRAQRIFTLGLKR